MTQQLPSITTGTALHRVTASTVVTRALLTWTQQQECFWLLHLYASHLYTLDGAREWFTCLNITVRDHAAHIVIEDGNGKTLAEQHVDFTDFPLKELTLYGCWTGESWVLMLTSEY